jgi:hypothetical protein
MKWFDPSLSWDGGFNMQIAIVFGALRSGSTLLRLMLDAHPKISCSGEHDFLFDFLRPDGRYDRDSLERDRVFRMAGIAYPDGVGVLHEAAVEMIRRFTKPGAEVAVLMIHRNLDRALSLFPDAPVIHLLRDPRDVAFSCVGMGWAGNGYYGAGHWFETEMAWDANKRRVSNGLDLRYEALIQAPEMTLTNVADFLGQKYDPAMLTYDQNSTYSKPDPSMIEQWRKKPWQDVGLVEQRVGFLLAARGYTSSGYDRMVRLGRRRRSKLAIENKACVWQYRVARYGVFDPLAVAVGRRLGIASIERTAQRRIDEKTALYMK